MILIFTLLWNITALFVYSELLFSEKKLSEELRKWINSLTNIKLNINIFWVI